MTPLHSPISGARLVSVNRHPAPGVLAGTAPVKAKQPSPPPSPGAIPLFALHGPGSAIGTHPIAPPAQLLSPSAVVVPSNVATITSSSTLWAPATGAPIPRLPAIAVSATSATVNLRSIASPPPSALTRHGY